MPRLLASSLPTKRVEGKPPFELVRKEGNKSDKFPQEVWNMTKDPMLTSKKISRSDYLKHH